MVIRTPGGAKNDFNQSMHCKFFLLFHPHGIFYVFVVCLIIQLFSCFSPFQVSDQVLDCGEISHIDVRVRRSYFAHVGSRKHDRDDILIQDLKELLRDVVRAHGILERQVELVLLAEKVQAVVLIILGAIEVSTVAVDVDGGDEVDHVDQVLATHSRPTVGHILSNCNALFSTLLVSQLLVVLTKLLDVLFQLAP